MGDKIEKNVLIFMEKYHLNTDVNEALLFLKDSNASYIECVWVVKRVLGVTIPKAEEIVMNSTAWILEKPNILNFKGQFLNFLEDSGL